MGNSKAKRVPHPCRAFCDRACPERSRRAIFVGWDEMGYQTRANRILRQRMPEEIRRA